MRRKLIVGLAIITLIFAFYVTSKPFYVTDEHATINSAKELKIDASEIREGWEGYFYYMNEPSTSLKEFSEILEANKEKLRKNITGEETFQKNLEKDKAYFLELSSELEECRVKDGYFLSMKRESPKLLQKFMFLFLTTQVVPKNSII
jgi:hypothetical protein